MTMQEVLELIKMNGVLYKQSEKPLTDAEMSAMGSVWFYHFKDYPGDVVKRAFLAANAVCKFPVQPADIFAQLKAMAKEKQMPGTEAWERLKEAVNKAKRFTSWRDCPMIVSVDETTGKPVKSDGKKELQNLFNALPGPIREYLGSTSALVDFTRLTDEEIERYRRAEFVKFYACALDDSPSTLMIDAVHRPEKAGALPGEG